ncbi:MAG: hypothetical protein ACFFG0_47365 [Candidatus Thorarchaeota archaeon]
MDLELNELNLIIEGLESIEKNFMQEAMTKSIFSMVVSAREDESAENATKRAMDIVEKEGKLDLIKKDEIEVLKAKIVLLIYLNMKK